VYYVVPPLGKWTQNPGEKTDIQVEPVIKKPFYALIRKSRIASGRVESYGASDTISLEEGGSAANKYGNTYSFVYDAASFLGRGRIQAEVYGVPLRSEGAFTVSAGGRQIQPAQETDVLASTLESSSDEESQPGAKVRRVDFNTDLTGGKVRLRFERTASASGREVWFYPVKLPIGVEISSQGGFKKNEPFALTSGAGLEAVFTVTGDVESAFVDYLTTDAKYQYVRIYFRGAAASSSAKTPDVNMNSGAGPIQPIGQPVSIPQGDAFRKELGNAIRRETLANFSLSTVQFYYGEGGFVKRQDDWAVLSGRIVEAQNKPFAALLQKQGGTWKKVELSTSNSLASDLKSWQTKHRLQKFGIFR
jgi:hypothetical protein